MQCVQNGLARTHAGVRKRTHARTVGGPVLRKKLQEYPALHQFNANKSTDRVPIKEIGLGTQMDEGEGRG